jgi:hypothetical protein
LQGRGFGDIPGAAAPVAAVVCPDHGNDAGHCEYGQKGDNKDHDDPNDPIALSSFSAHAVYLPVVVFAQ